MLGTETLLKLFQEIKLIQIKNMLVNRLNKLLSKKIISVSLNQVMSSLHSSRSERGIQTRIKPENNNENKN
jgi:hypothetical protein